MGTNNIVLVHGLWMTPLSWEFWAHHYTERGYSVYAPSWPGMERDIRALRHAPETYANHRFQADRRPLREARHRSRKRANHHRAFLRRTRGPGIVRPWTRSLRRGHRIGAHQGNLDSSLFHDASGHAAVDQPDEQPPLRAAHAGAVPLRVHEYLLARGILSRLPALCGARPRPHPVPDRARQLQSVCRNAGQRTAQQSRAAAHDRRLRATT